MTMLKLQNPSEADREPTFMVYILEAQHLMADRITPAGNPWLVGVTAVSLESAIETVRKSCSCPLRITPLA
jgi:hypothetical protein